MWKAVVGHNVSVKVEAEGDDWDTDPDFVNDISEREQRWGAKTIEGSGRAEHINIHQLRNKVSEEHEVIKKKELETGPKASYGYGGKFGTERDRMDKCAVGHEYVADVGKHSSQTDAAQGFGGKFGVQRDRADKSAVGFEYKSEVEKHSSQKDYSKGFGGRYGVERDKVDKAAVGFDYKSQGEKHDSQKDYSVGFGGKFGVQRDRQDKNALGWDHQEEVQLHASQRDYAKGFGGRYGVQKEEVPPTLPPRPADLDAELCKVPSQAQPTYSESLDVGGDYEELPEPSDYCDSTSGGAEYEELPAPLGKLDATYDFGGDGGEDYEVILPQEPRESHPHLGNAAHGPEGQSPGKCAVALYDYQGDGDDEISFDPDDTITHIEMVDEGWWRGQCHGRVGLFPANYVKLLQ